MTSSDYDPITGKPIDKTYLEINLPEYLQKDLNAFKNGLSNNSTLLDCFWCELYSSINVAEIADEITEEHATYLRQTYLYEKE